MILRDLFFDLHKYEYNCNKSKDENLQLANDFFKELRKLIGVDEYKFDDNHGYLSKRQHVVSENAIIFIMKNELNMAVNETLDFMQNYQDNNHEMTYEEYTVLNCILLCYEGRCNET